MILSSGLPSDFFSFVLHSEGEISAQVMAEADGGLAATEDGGILVGIRGIHERRRDHKSARSRASPPKDVRRSDCSQGETGDCATF